MIGREAIAAALFAKFSALPGYATKSRVFQHWTDTPAIEQPALFMRQTGHVAMPAYGFPTKWELSYQVGVYAQCPDPGVAPSTIQNPLLDGIDAALAPDNVQSRCLTLGGLAHHVWIDGEISTDEGLLGTQTVALITIKILVQP